MNQHISTIARERAVFQYVRALDAGNLDVITAVLQIAEKDNELDRIIAEINTAYADELGLTPTSQDIEKVRNLLQAHLSSAFQEVDQDAPLTVSEVVARLIAGRSVPESDKEIGRKLIHIHVALPEWLSLPEIRKLGKKLSIKPSDRFWKVFRDAAIQMSMGRGQAQMAATRHNHSHYSHTNTEIHQAEENHDSK